MASVQVTTKDELPAVTIRAFPVEGKEVLVADCDGTLYAVSNTCTPA
jgi:nitrite reductase/ring-hydroxylating ferredoxin subunit